MQPVLARGSRVVVYVLATLVVGGLLSVALARRDAVAVVEAAVVIVPLVLVYGFVCLSSWYVCRATPLKTSSAVSVVANVGGATLFATFLWLLLGQGLAKLAASRPAFAGAARLLADETVLLLTVGALLYLLAIATHYVLLAVDETRAAEQRALEVQLLAREAELKALRAQIEPHFLFNSLNSISALTTADPGGARRMCVLLAEFLRSSLNLGTRERIPLGEEVALIERFFEIEQVRFGTRLQFTEDVEPTSRACLVPPLLMQPLVENAVRHGVAGMLEGGTVSLRVARADEALQIVLENPVDGDQPRQSRPGVGLTNVRRRLATEYGNQARLTVENGSGSFKVTITLPAAHLAP